MGFSDWLRTRITDHTPGVGRVFIVCGAMKNPGCNRVIPYYKLYGRDIKTFGCPKCGQIFVRPSVIPEWKAALWLVWGWLTRQGDPRMPLRKATSKYA